MGDRGRRLGSPSARAPGDDEVARHQVACRHVGLALSLQRDVRCSEAARDGVVSRRADCPARPASRPRVDPSKSHCAGRCWYGRLPDPRLIARRSERRPADECVGDLTDFVETTALHDWALVGVNVAEPSPRPVIGTLRQAIKGVSSERQPKGRDRPDRARCGRSRTWQAVPSRFRGTSESTGGAWSP